MTHPTTHHPSPPLPAIELGPAGTTTLVDRIAAGAPIGVTWPAEDRPLRAFLAKAIAWAYDPTVTVGELYNLVYGDQDPLLVVDTTSGRAVVTRATHDDPAWSLLMELIDRKRAALGHLDLERAAAQFTMPVSAAALKLGITTGAVRQLIERGKLVARKEGSSWLLDPHSVASYSGIPRGPRPIAKAAAELVAAATTTPPRQVEVRIGHEKESHVRIKGGRVVDPKTGDGVMVGALEPGWTRLHVLAYGPDGKGRLFIFEPAPEEELDWKFGDFYVRGPAREVEHDNNPKRARERFDSLPKE